MLQIIIRTIGYSCFVHLSIVFHQLPLYLIIIISSIATTSRKLDRCYQFRMDHLDHEHEYSNGRRKVIKQTEEETGPIETIANTYGETGLAEAEGQRYRTPKAKLERLFSRFRRPMGERERSSWESLPRCKEFLKQQVGRSDG